MNSILSFADSQDKQHSDSARCPAALQNQNPSSLLTSAVCVEFVHCPCDCVAFLQILHDVCTSQRRAGWGVNWPCRLPLACWCVIESWINESAERIKDGVSVNECLMIGTDLVGQRACF